MEAAPPRYPPRAPGARRLSGHARALTGDTLAFYDRCERELGGIQRTHVWGLPVWLVFDPAAIEQILVRQHRAFVKSVGLRSTVRAFGDGLLTSDRETWRRQRRIIQPSFQAGRLESYAANVKLATQRLLDSLADDETRNIHADVTELCFDVLTRSMFGEDVAHAKDMLSAAAEALHGFHDYYSRWVGSAAGLAFSAFRLAVTRLGKPDFQVDPTLLPSEHGRQFRRIMRELDDFVYELIRRRELSPGDDSDLVTLLLRATDDAGQQLDRRQIRDEIVTMFLAGHETGAAAISWTLHLLGRHPEVASALHAELDQRLGGQLPDKSATENLPFMRQVLSESLRLYPPAFRISRTCVERAHVGGFVVEPGTEIIISQWSVQRSGRFFEAPDEFRPARWTPELRASLPRFAWFPFGGGPRTCIGDAFALMESSIVIAGIAQHFDLHDPTGGAIRPFQGVTLLPERNHLPLRLRRRAPLSARASLPTRAAHSYSY